MKVEPCKQIEAIDVKPWTMKDGIITEYKIEGVVWMPKQKLLQSKVVDNININFTKPVDRQVKQNYFIKWLSKNKHVGDVFNLDEFFEVYPRHKKDLGCRGRLDKILSDLILDGGIKQWVNQGDFKVLKL